MWLGWVVGRWSYLGVVLVNGFYERAFRIVGFYSIFKVGFFGYLCLCEYVYHVMLLGCLNIMKSLIIYLSCRFSAKKYIISMQSRHTHDIFA